MVNEYKRIVLLKGLMGINDHDFKMVKSLLSKELKLNKMQDEYDRVKIADLMEDKFPKDAGLDQLIKLYKEIPGLGDIANKLKNQKAKGNRGEPWMPLFLQFFQTCAHSTVIITDMAYYGVCLGMYRMATFQGSKY